ncbi:hypothetical protein D9611_013886 [Ephemerocybe angulata]|uniref:Uncharacterized protein n=1 Tax=Ephemerocybe angulata TaxID=980116 RepID=A0A8H5FA18_9AGAR|nr:hypothetical protein D9611_013886 [Tulosesus angulatus]
MPPLERYPGAATMSKEHSSSKRIVSSSSSSSPTSSSSSPPPSASPLAKPNARPNAKKDPGANKKPPKGYPKDMANMLAMGPWGRRWGKSCEPTSTTITDSDMSTYVLDKHGDHYLIPMEDSLSGKEIILDHHSSHSLPVSRTTSMAPSLPSTPPTPVAARPSSGEYRSYTNQRQAPLWLNLDHHRPQTAASLDDLFLSPYGVRVPHNLSSSPHPSESSSAGSYFSDASSAIRECFSFNVLQGMPLELEPPLSPSVASDAGGEWNDIFNLNSFAANQAERNYESSESSNLGAQVDQALLFQQQQVPIAQHPRASGMPVASEYSQYRQAPPLDHQFGNFQPHEHTTGSDMGGWSGHDGFAAVGGGDRNVSRAEESVQRMAPSNAGYHNWQF